MEFPTLAQVAGGEASQAKGKKVKVANPRPGPRSKDRLRHLREGRMVVQLEKNLGIGPGGGKKYYWLADYRWP
ncbi:MAG: hypothetical protein AUH86_22115 [Acidobacteria bacterium 13_1_40CM_4_58_4]|nr:MAG: hypothetical protein AUH86_22115 [Acidobacteria bacterium 13_1_40CM_4_58_4]